MKKYLKPEINVKSLLAKESLSNLANWLEGQNYDHLNCSITVYDMQS